MVNRVDKIEAHTVNLIQSNSLFSRYTKDINNNKFTVSADDTRLLAGELIGHSGRWICIDNIVYSPKKVESIYNISYRTILRRCKSDKWPNWSFK